MKKYFDWKYAGKAIMTGLTALVGGLIFVVTGNEGFQDVSVAEWLGVVAFVLASYGFTYNAPVKSGAYGVEAGK